MKKLIIVGSGGHARETAWVAENAGFEVMGYLDEDVRKHNTLISGFPCLGSLELIKKLSDCELTVAIGNSRIRKKVVNQIAGLCHPRYATIIHPTAILSGKKIVISAGAVLFPHVCLTENIAIGEHTILNVKSSVSHDSTIGNFVTLNPNATICGACVIHDGVEIGASATVIQEITIQSGALIGAGAVILNALNANYIYVGVPAKPIKQLSNFQLME
ncbi:MAG: acetyltransferase [Gammaproteobacteria bacterium]|nr:acetyltransferase [Gammaproteobacteria bacterium]